MHISLSIPFNDSTSSFQFINTCNEHEKRHHSLENISLQNLLLVMTLKHVKNMDMIKLFVGFY
jgi:hypothetical protein